MHRYRVDPRLERLNIPDLGEVVDEAMGVGAEYAKICGSCGGEHQVCIYIGLIHGDGEILVDLKGLSIELSLETIVDRDFLLGLLKYVETVVSERGRAVLYIPRDYAIGVYHMVCRETRLSQLKHSVVEYEEILYLESDRS